MEWFGFGFMGLIVVIGIFAVRWALQKQKKLADDLANDPEYMAVPRGKWMWPTVKARGGELATQADLEAIDLPSTGGAGQRILLWHVRVSPMGLASRGITFKLDRLGIPGGFSAQAGAQGGFPHGGFPSGDPRFDMIYLLDGRAAPISGAIVTSPEVRAALQTMDTTLRVMRVDPDDSLFVEVQADDATAADAKKTLGLVRALGAAVQAAGRAR